MAVSSVIVTLTVVMGVLFIGDYAITGMRDGVMVETVQGNDVLEVKPWQGEGEVSTGRQMDGDDVSVESMVDSDVPMERQPSSVRAVSKHPLETDDWRLALVDAKNPVPKSQTVRLASLSNGLLFDEGSFVELDAG